jgi:hypothetical protein
MHEPIAATPDFGSERSTATSTRDKKLIPVTLWAAFGAAMLAVALYVWIRWIAGPYFKRVPAGPSHPPGWMKAVLVGGEIVLPLIAVGIVYWLLIRPWRRTGRVTTDGLLVVCFGLTWWQEPFSDYFNHWLTYSSYLFNRGSWAQELPGWLSYVHPGATVVVPILITGPMYMSLFVLIAMSGSWSMGRLQKRFPSLTNVRVVLLMIVLGSLIDLVSEGFYFLPLGFWEYPGGIGPSLFPHSYAKMPLINAVVAGVFWTAMASLRYFTNDHGETCAESGLHKLSLRGHRRSIVRFLALLGGVNAAVLTFNLPAPLIIGPRVAKWPKDLQQRSYFTYVCGASTNIICPQPGLPDPRGNDYAPRAGKDGTLRLQDGTVARIVPYKKNTDGPFHGPLFGW